MSKVIFSATMTSGDVTVTTDLLFNKSARVKITLSDRDMLGSLTVEPLVPRMEDAISTAVRDYFRNPAQAIIDLLARVANDHDWLTFTRMGDGLAYVCVVDQDNNRSTKARLEG